MTAVLHFFIHTLAYIIYKEIIIFFYKKQYSKIHNIC